MSSVKIIQTIKRDLKAKGISYKDLALYLKMTEAGVKKLLSKDDISFNKLKLICDLLESSPADLIQAANENSDDTQSFSEKQVKFFLNNHNFFYFFMKLAYEQKKPKAVQAEFKLSTRSLNLYLKKLEDLGLIKRHPYDRTQIVGGLPFAIKTRGTDLELLKYEIAFQQLQALKQKKSEALSGAGLFLTEPQKEEFLSKIFGAVIDFSRASKANRKKQNPLALEYTFMSFLNDGAMFNKIVEIP